MAKINATRALSGISAALQSEDVPSSVIRNVAECEGHYSIRNINKILSPHIPKITSSSTVLAFGDNHHDSEFKVFVMKSLHKLRNVGYTQLCFEFPVDIENLVKQKLEAFKAGEISFDELTDSITKRNGEKSWNFGAETPSLITAILATASILDMNIIMIDKPYDTKNRDMKSRNLSWAKNIQRAMSYDKGVVVFGGAFHFDQTNRDCQYDECEAAKGVDKMLCSTNYPINWVNIQPIVPSAIYSKLISDRTETLEIRQDKTYDLEYSQLGIKNKTIFLPEVKNKWLDEINHSIVQAAIGEYKKAHSKKLMQRDEELMM